MLGLALEAPSPRCALGGDAELSSDSQMTAWAVRDLHRRLGPELGTPLGGPAGEISLPRPTAWIRRAYFSCMQVLAAFAGRGRATRSGVASTHPDAASPWPGLGSTWRAQTDPAKASAIGGSPMCCNSAGVKRLEDAGATTGSGVVTTPPGVAGHAVA